MFCLRAGRFPIAGGLQTVHVHHDCLYNKYNKLEMYCNFACVLVKQLDNSTLSANGMLHYGHLYSHASICMVTRA